MPSCLLNGNPALCFPNFLEPFLVTPILGQLLKGNFLELVEFLPGKSRIVLCPCRCAPTHNFSKYCFPGQLHTQSSNLLFILKVIVGVEPHRDTHESVLGDISRWQGYSHEHMCQRQRQRPIGGWAWVHVETGISVVRWARGAVNSMSGWFNSGS